MFLLSRWRLLVPCGDRLSPLAENWWRQAVAVISASRRMALADYEVAAAACHRDRPRSHFFEQPEEVWRLVEMWDKAALGRPTGTSGVVNRHSGADRFDWRNREGERTMVSIDQGVVDVPAPLIEIQQDGTMAVVPDGSVAGTDAGLDLDSLSTSVQS
ncbi:hypothetical protein NDU88_006623 [Pleurodeles waltl]|uniref:Uncharacterized protein n=1 Tax=Pleurodeles waltl TaxID=8319 RepID=A0AAV7RQS0_PLEWA|nr:hypothetical protein NDU88_006623 [Pleurodeles waltl]